MARIVRVDASTVRIPLPSAIRFSTRRVAHRYFCLVRIRDEHGRQGMGFTYEGAAYTGNLTELAVRHVLAPILCQREAEDIEGLWRSLYQESLLIGRRGLILRAMSALDIGLWDLRAKSEGKSLARLLGGKLSSVPAYASGGYYHDAVEPDDATHVEMEIGHSVALGFANHKIKVGGRSVAVDADRVRAACAVIGDMGRLALDANNAFESGSSALRALETFQTAAGSTEIWWMEEPFPPDRYDEYSFMAGRTDVPLAAGEVHQTVEEFVRLAESGVSVLQPDACVVGGATEWLRVARMADAGGLSVAPHWHPQLHAHLASGSQSMLSLEYFIQESQISGFGALLRKDQDSQVNAGLLTIGQQPGHGLDVPVDLVEAYRIEPGLST